MTNDPATIAKGLTEALAEFDKADAKCPVRTRKDNWREKKCPTCGSGPTGGCGLEIAGAFRFIGKCRTYLQEQQDNG